MLGTTRFETLCDGRDVVNPPWFADRYDTPVSLKHGCIEPIDCRLCIQFPITPRRKFFDLGGFRGQSPWRRFFDLGGFRGQSPWRSMF